MTSSSPSATSTAAPTHVLVIPVRHVASAADLTAQDGELVARLMTVAHERDATPGPRWRCRLARAMHCGSVMKNQPFTTIQTANLETVQGGWGRFAMTSVSMSAAIAAPPPPPPPTTSISTRVEVRG